MPKTILITPLNWGIGHATRCIPIIVELQKAGHKIIIGSDGAALTLLTKKFPDLEFVELPSYKISYPKSGKMMAHMVRLMPGILSAIREENKLTQRIVVSQKVDVVISDNRYGVHHSSTKNIFITHQIKIKAPFGSDILAMLHLRYLHRFNEIWVPDSAGKTNISGGLSHNCTLPKNSKFIGVLSQFSTIENYQEPKEMEGVKSFVLVMMSGPEPQRSMFEGLVLAQIKNSTLPVVVVGGNLILSRNIEVNNCVHFGYVPPINLGWLITNAEVVISRAGYSSIMDLISLKRTAVLVPTPGQTEQEYLASSLSSTGMFIEMNQREFNLNEGIKSGQKLRVNHPLTEVDYSEEFRLALNNI